MVLTPRQPISQGRPYRYHLNGLTSLDPSSDDLSDSLSDHSLLVPSLGLRPSHHLCSLVSSIPRSSAAIFDRPSHDSSSASPSRKRSISLVASILLSSPITGALSSTRLDLLPSPTRIRIPESAADLEGCSNDCFEPYVPREDILGVDVEDESSKPSRYRGTDLEMDDDVVRSDGINIDPEIQAKIDECITYADALRDKGIDARVVVEEEGAVEVTYETLGDLGHMFVATGQQSTDMLERIRELERVNMRLIDMMDVASQRVTQSQRRGCMKWNGRNRNGENRNGENRNKENGYGGNRNGENGNGNGNEGGYGYNFGGFMPARECTYQDSLKGQPLRFNGTEGVVGLTRWFKKMETVFHISNYLEKYQVKTYKADDRSVLSKKRGSEDGYRVLELGYEIRIANNLMDKKLKIYARSAKNKGRLENNPRDNHRQQLIFKRQKVRGQNMARAYMAGNNKKTSHTTKDCKVTVTLNTQRAPVRNHPGIVCYECGRPGHFKKDCPKLRNQMRGNQTGNKNRNKTGNQSGGNEATTTAYAIGGGGANPDSNVVKGPFLLNNYYASMLFNSGADRSFVLIGLYSMDL
uniref:CCHC-type domain-containing protein n=1 Tax=Tanacetum cinerariifolium TaxID=118510 RepID=A0A6L2NXM2_TANCI|nr:hypothetical protein [Tanacetum cinerariifolium]